MIDQLNQFIMDHPKALITGAVGLQYVWSAAVSSLPVPGPMASPWYQFFFAFAHKIAGNIFSPPGK